MLRCGVVEENEDKMVCLYGGLNRNIWDIIDYKEYDSIQGLFQLAMLAEKELQGRQQSTNKGAAISAPRLFTSNTRAPSSRAAIVPSNSATRASPSSTPGKMTTTPVAPRMTSSSSSTSRSSDIKCHHYQGHGHMQQECLSKHTYVTATDGGYISTSDLEDEDIVVANITRDDNDHETNEEEIHGVHATEHYRSIIVP
jgi:hypothetical protein